MVSCAGGILQIPFIIEGEKRIQILIMVVGNITAVLVGGATEYGMRKLIACGVDLPAPVDEGMGMLRRIYGIEHHGEIAAGRVFHTCGDVKAADGKAVLLILHGARADSHIRENIGKITPVFRIKHFICSGKAGFIDGANVHFPHGDKSLQEVGLFLRIRLVHDSLIAFAGGAGFVGVNPGNQD